MEQGLSHLDARSGGSSTLPAPNGKGDIAVGMENFKPYDSAHYLETEEAIAAFLEDVMEDSDDDPAYVTRALGVVARARMLTQLANDAGMSRRELIGALTADPPADAATAAKIARALGMSFMHCPEVKQPRAR
ncbi:addiction module antidote protein [Pedomonas sp. V897]|uniref:addiction module antidote protein n=1 Tax=Pedomonas sp. V897 TaxID=3446482 RepID=UPI003F505508